MCSPLTDTNMEAPPSTDLSTLRKPLSWVATKRCSALLTPVHPPKDSLMC